MITPGPWTFENKKEFGGPLLVVHGSGYVVAEIENDCDGPAIAAVPDLIQVCKIARKRLLKASDPHPADQRIANLIEDVLRKAGIEEETWEDAYTL